MSMTQLVTTDWLAKEIGASDLRIVDATAYMPGDERDPADEFAKAHIPGAVFMDLPNLNDSESPLPNMLPSAEKFSSRMRALGIGDGSRIVLYDNSALASSTRAWWMFNIFGAHDVALLDGSMKKWIAEGRDIESGKHEVRSRHFTAWKDDSALRNKQDIIANLASGKEQIVDARPPERFEGKTPEPREDIAAGHIPDSSNIPFSKLLCENGTWKQGDEICGILTDAGVAMDKPIVTSCGSGMTAAALLFGLKLTGKDDVALYDGSWSEWGMDPDTPKAKGAA